MAVFYNGADPREVAWAKAEMESQRQERVALGDATFCRVCQQQGPIAWMVDGRCGPSLTATRPCVRIEQTRGEA